MTSAVSGRIVAFARLSEILCTAFGKSIRETSAGLARFYRAAGTRGLNAKASTTPFKTAA